MPNYMVFWKANPSAWPTDAKQALAALEGVTGGGDHLLKAGAIKELGWFTPQAGYAIFEADSKATCLNIRHKYLIRCKLYPRTVVNPPDTIRSL